jgi:5-formyltetrahydrofolate cyclo-ligase
MADIDDQKRALRLQAAEARQAAHAANLSGQAVQTLRAHFLAQVPLSAGAVIGGYWPIRTEIYVRPLLAALHERGHVCCLPVAQPGEPLEFRVWRPGDALVPGMFGIHVPDRTARAVVPDVLLIPLLAFDADGRRLGYGGGFYDRTISRIRASRPVATIGIAYAAQEVDKVPVDDCDRTLDWIVTEKGVRHRAPEPKPMKDINEEKRTLRVRAAESRRIARAADPSGQAAESLRRNFMEKVPVPAGAVIGGYWPIGTELDVRPLLVALHARGHTCGLPTHQARQPLIFHRWRPNDKLVTKSFGIQVPDPHTPLVAPDILLLPMLAFDARGRRLGYGGGYYDRTIPQMRARKPLLTVGIAYAAQEVTEVPVDGYDQPLDWIVTDESVRRIERRRFAWLRKFFGS